MRSRWLLSDRARAWIAEQAQARVAPARVDHGVDLAHIRRPYLYEHLKGRLVAERGGYPFQTAYTDKRVLDNDEVDIDHIVSLEEVAESGGWGWTRPEWDAYQSDPFCLMLADARVNRVDKRAKDCAAWVPPHNVRWFLGDVAMIKLAYGLHFTAEEAAAIKQGLLGAV